MTVTHWFRRRRFLLDLIEDTTRAHNAINAAYDRQVEENARQERDLLCSWELLEQRDGEYANLARRCAKAEEEVDFWRRFYNKTMPTMDAS